MSSRLATGTHSGAVTVVTRTLSFATSGDAHVVNLTSRLHDLLEKTGLTAGTVTVFAPGATAGITTLEYEQGVVRDFRRLFDQIVPPDQPYAHNAHLGDGNGHSHVRAGLLGPTLVVPFTEGRLTLGTWQEVCFVCFDNRARDRTVVVQFMGV